MKLRNIKLNRTRRTVRTSDRTPANTTIRRAIVDKNGRIGRDVQIINKDNVQEAEREDLGFYIRSGIIVTLKGATIADNTII